MGTVQVEFVKAVSALCEATSGGHFTGEQRERLQGLADVIFSSTRRLWPPDPGELARGWRVALR
jgi:hypothetical protein